MGQTDHLCQPPSRHNVSRMHKPVQMPRRLLDRLAHLVVTVEVEHIRHEIQRILVVLDLRIEASQIEPVRQVLLVDLTEVFVATIRDELQLPGQPMETSFCCHSSMLGGITDPVPPVAGVVTIRLAHELLHPDLRERRSDSCGSTVSRLRRAAVRRCYRVSKTELPRTKRNRLRLPGCWSCGRDICV
jgi:hypothetical protein